MTLYVKDREEGYIQDFFKNIFLEYYHQLCTYTLRYIKDPDLAEDIVQDVFVALWSKREEIDFNLPIKPLLYRYTHNKAIDYLKNSSYNNERLNDHMYKELDDYVVNLIINQPDEILNYNDLNKKILNCIDKLPDQCKTVYRLSRFTNLKNREIAEKLSISIKTVEKHISKALSEIRRQLGADGFLSFFIFLLFFIKYK